MLTEFGTEILGLPEYVIKASQFKCNTLPEAADEVLRIWFEQQVNRQEAFHSINAALKRCRQTKLKHLLGAWFNQIQHSPRK